MKITNSERTLSKVRLSWLSVMFFHLNYLQVIPLFLLQFGVIGTCNFFKDCGLMQFLRLWQMYSCLFTPICKRNHAIFHTNTLSVFEYYIRILSSKVFTKIVLMITNESVRISGLVDHLDNFLLTGRPWTMIERARTSHEMRSVASLPGKSRQLHYIVPLHWKGKQKQKNRFPRSQ